METAQGFDESGKVVDLIYRKQLLRDYGLYLVTIHHPSMDHTYAGTAFPYKVSGPGELSSTDENIAIAGTYARHSFKLVVKESGAGAQSQKKVIFTWTPFAPIR